MKTESSFPVVHYVIAVPVLLLGLVLSVTGCCADSANSAESPMTSAPIVPEAPSVATVLAGTDWSLLSLFGEGVGGAGSEPITLSVDHAGRVSGHSAVNRYTGTMEDHGNASIGFRMGVSTMRAGSPEMMKLERRYLELLPNVKRASIVDGKLVMDTETQPAVAVFARKEKH